MSNVFPKFFMNAAEDPHPLPAAGRPPFLPFSQMGEESEREWTAPLASRPKLIYCAS
jgi:hypothetical protein